MKTKGNSGLKRYGEDLLAADKKLLTSATETAKYKKRKAAEHAEAERLRHSKSTKRPTVEDMLADIIRVASDPDTNPRWKFKSMSGQRYEIYGRYPIEFIYEQYGQFEHAMQVCGLRDQPGTTAKKAVRAKESRREHAARYMERWVLPHVRKNPALERDLTGTKLVLSISDTHSTFLDPFTWWCFLRACGDLKPDIVYLNGDILEGSEISRFAKIPGHTIPLALEFEFAREMFRQVREVVGPDTEVIWGAGNHGLDRLASYLTQQAPAFAKLPTMKFDKLAGLGDLNVTLAQGGKICSPEGTENDAPGMLLYNFYRVTHGTRLGKTPALQELRDAGRSGQSGHIHRGALIFGVTEAHRTLSWMQTPMGCNERAGASYIKSSVADWQKGFGAAWLHPGGIVRQYPVITDDGVCIIEGYVYENKRRIKEQDTNTNWLLKFEVPS